MITIQLLSFRDRKEPFPLVLIIYSTHLLCLAGGDAVSGRNCTCRTTMSLWLCAAGTHPSWTGTYHSRVVFISETGRVKAKLFKCLKVVQISETWEHLIHFQHAASVQIYRKGSFCHFSAHFRCVVWNAWAVCQSQFSQRLVCGELSKPSCGELFISTHRPSGRWIMSSAFCPFSLR